MMPTNEYVEMGNDSYYVAGTRIGLDVVVYDFRDGRSAEAIFEAYPSIGSLAKVYGAITFILEHPKEVEAYLGDQDRRYEEFKAQNPLTPDMIERFESSETRKVTEAVLSFRFQADTDLNPEIGRGLRRREPSVDFRAAPGVIADGTPDSEVLQIAADDDRVLISRDVNNDAGPFCSIRCAARISGVAADPFA